MVSADLNTRFNQLSGVSSILGLVVSVIPLLRGVGQYVPTWAPLTMAERLDMLLKLSIIILIAHALFWLGLEKLFGWDYATGRTPKGFRAVVMSLSLTLPALTIPIFYQYATAKAVLSSNHVYGAILSVSGGAIAYLVLFGMDDRVFPGVREVLLVRFRQHQHPLWAEISATLAYALILIVLIAAPYRLLVLPTSPALVSLAWPALASLVTFFGLSAYILLKYPDSLNTSSYWGFLRGIIAGMFTVVSVCTALYA